jgi:hypothetical protein
MKTLSAASAILGATLLSFMPLSVHWSTARGGSPSLVLQTAKAAELAIPAHRRAYRYSHYGYSRVGLYDPFCGGPYVGGGWNGGTYYGGPWIDLRCYGLLIER